MNSLVLDSSAVLAVIFQEKGKDAVEPILDGSAMSSINVAEVFGKLAEKGVLTKAAIESFEGLGINIIDFDYQQAKIVAELRPLTKHIGLSLGDRSCLALAVLQGSTAVTADKSWKGLSFCPVEVIR